MTDTSPRRWHAHPILHSSGDTVEAHSLRVVTMCHDLSACIGHPLHDSDLPHAALHHDAAEAVLGDMPGPAKAMFPDLARAYAEAEAIVLRNMGLSWQLTARETKMLDLCDKLDAVLWARNHGVTGPAWDAALIRLRCIAADIGATEWLDTRLK